jgi:DNA-binding FadR family transcriptional regulator
VDILHHRVPGAGSREITKRTVKDQVADKIASMIQTGLLQPGDELPSERELAATLSVSRESVRGALSVLAGRKMIGVSQGARTRVLGTGGQTLQETVTSVGLFKGKSIDEVTEARALVEAEVVRMAAQRITPAEIDRLEALVAAQAAMIGDPVRFQISDREFHTALYEACGNDLLASFVIDLYSFALDTRRKALKRKDAIARSVEDHRAVVAALRTRHPGRAADAMRHHLDSVYKTTLSELGKTTP